MFVLERCPSFRESNKRSKERQGPILSVRFTEVSVKRESTISLSFSFILLRHFQETKTEMGSSKIHSGKW